MNDGQEYRLGPTVVWRQYHVCENRGTPGWSPAVLVAGQVRAMAPGNAGRGFSCVAQW